MKNSVIRIVKMTFHPERVADFLDMFDERSSRIRAFRGCESLDLISDTQFANVMTTISVWTSEEALAAYRTSDVFNDTWEVTKEMFADRPEAASYTPVRRVEPG